MQRKTAVGLGALLALLVGTGAMWPETPRSEVREHRSSRAREGTGPAPEPPPATPSPSPDPVPAALASGGGTPLPVATQAAPERRGNLSDDVSAAAVVAAPTLVRTTRRLKADRTDVWLRFAELDVKSQLALQDRLAPDFDGPRVLRVGGRLRLAAPHECAPGESIVWVSEELGYLGAGLEVDDPDPARSGAVRAIFVEPTEGGDLRVTSSRPLDQ